MMKKKNSMNCKTLGVIFTLLLSFLFTGMIQAKGRYLLEAESFKTTGGWKVDQQYFDIMGSSYLLAHGMGEKVNDAKTEVKFPAKGKYHVWVRTKDWAPFPGWTG